MKNGYFKISFEVKNTTNVAIDECKALKEPFTKGELCEAALELFLKQPTDDQVDLLIKIKRDNLEYKIDGLDFDYMVKGGNV